MATKRLEGVRSNINSSVHFIHVGVCDGLSSHSSIRVAWSSPRFRANPRFLLQGTVAFTWRLVTNLPSSQNVERARATYLLLFPINLLIARRPPFLSGCQCTYKLVHTFQDPNLLKCNIHKRTFQQVQA
mmetsp:Transcript_3586/g.5191  ORF Transcript_3586/g.5191 Transcript_3586/m.5191 type:complete len:129 (+) Transcript_3586:459-845(+)